MQIYLAYLMSPDKLVNLSLSLLGEIRIRELQLSSAIIIYRQRTYY